MIPNIGPIEIVVVLIVALAVFGPKRLPELGSSLGRGIREFGTGLRSGEADALESDDSSTAKSPLSEAAVPSKQPVAATPQEVDIDA
jgi:sec-independent protein translocase protein TatA